jgi:carbon storage regulator
MKAVLAICSMPLKEVKLLILTRKIGESVQIGSNINVKIISVEGGQVRLGFDAPNSITIYRQEVASKIKQQNEMASESFGLDVLENISLKRKEL